MPEKHSKEPTMLKPILFTVFNLAALIAQGCAVSMIFIGVWIMALSLDPKAMNDGLHMVAIGTLILCLKAVFDIYAARRSRRTSRL